MSISGKIKGSKPLDDGLPDELLARTQKAAVRAVRAGQFAPTFRLPDIHGGNLALVDLIEKGPLVLSFYRGVWCGFCGAALGTLARFDQTIRSLGATHAAIGPAPSDDKQRAELELLSMPLLMDRGLKVTSAYGLTISLPDDLHGQYRRLGYVPSKITETSEWKIPVPATYIIDQFGRIVLASIDVDYRNRLDPAELIPALRGLQKRA